MAMLQMFGQTGLRFLSDMEAQEISVAAGMLLSTVKTHIQRAMKSVRTRLASLR